MRPLSSSIHPESLGEVAAGQNAIHIGGIKISSDPRFVDYDHFDGCISSTSTTNELIMMNSFTSVLSHFFPDVVVEIDGTQLHPLLGIYLFYVRASILRKRLSYEFFTAYLGYQKSGLEVVTSHDPEGTVPHELIQSTLLQFYELQKFYVAQCRDVSVDNSSVTEPHAIDYVAESLPSCRNRRGSKMRRFFDNSSGCDRRCHGFG